ncbi:hypothetical protein WA016_05297 [Myxococcus stipitatus]
MPGVTVRGVGAGAALVGRGAGAGEALAGAEGATGRGEGVTPVGRGVGATGAAVPAVGRGVGRGVGAVGAGSEEDGVCAALPGVEAGRRMTSTAGTARRVFRSFTVVRYLMRGARACPASRLKGG